MFDARIRTLIDEPLNRAGRVLAEAGITANQMTLLGFLVGLAAVPAILFEAFLAAAALVAISRVSDGLDGAIARATRKTDFGGYLDIVLDFIFYGAVPLAFAILDPAANGLAAAVLLMSFFANGTTFLAFAVMAAKRGIETTAQGSKSLYYLSGLAEGAETIAFLIAICLFPGWFVVLAYAYAALCFASAGARIIIAWTALEEVDTDPSGPAQVTDRPA